VDFQEAALHLQIEETAESGETPLTHVAERSYVIGKYRHPKYGLLFRNHANLMRGAFTMVPDKRPH